MVQNTDNSSNPEKNALIQQRILAELLDFQKKDMNPLDHKKNKIENL